MNILEGLQQEIKRNQHLLKVYQEIPTGAFGAAFIAEDIKKGEKALVSGDIIEMVHICKVLQDNN